ncbi:MAG: Rpn family recombination-promoting nuclease/putative transposase, partial [Francisellaceae bacterium]
MVHGRPTPYPYPTDIMKMFKDEALAQQYFLKPILVDYGQYSDKALLEHGEISAVEIAFKHVYDKRVSSQAIEHLMQGLSHCTNITIRHNVYLYALDSWESNPTTMLDKYREYLKEDEKFVMTAAERLRQQGMQQGKIETALNMLKKGY